MLQRAQRVARRRGTNWTIVCALLLLTVVAMGTIPRLSRAERRALVAACPIAYVGVDGRIHLTNVEGTIDVELEGPSADGRIWFIGSPPAWSPDGELIAYTPGQSGEDGRVAVTEPGTGMYWELRAWRRDARFGGWVRDGVVHEVHFSLRDARHGTLLRFFMPPGPDFQTLQVAPAPQWFGGCISVGPTGVELRDDRFRVVRQIAPGRDEVTRPRVPKLDGTGAWIGWTLHTTWGPRRPQLIGVARVIGDTGGDSFRFIGDQFASAVFCDWTNDGNVLANVMEQPRQQEWCLVILDKDGRMLRRIPTDVPPEPGSGASWRRAKVTDR